MPSITTEVGHSLGKDLAVQRLNDFMTNVHQQFPGALTQVESQWHGNELRYGFTARGLRIQGTLTVEDQLARVECQLPFAAMLMRGMIEKEIRGQLEQMLRPA